MSVINKMLRDLDARRSEGALPDLVRPSSGDAMLGTRSVNLSRGGTALRWRWALLALLLAAASAAGAWYWLGLPAATPAPAAAMDAPIVVAQDSAPVETAPPSQSAASAPVMAASSPHAGALAPVAVPGPAPAHAGRSAVTGTDRPVAAPVAMASGPTRQPAATANVARAPVAPVTSPAAKSPTPPAAPAAAKPAPQGVETPKTQTIPSAGTVPAAVPTATTTTAPTTTRRSAALEEALAQAQALWSAGSREAAVDLMRDAVGVAERAPGANGHEELALLVREQTRMELALGRSAAVVQLLTRLEPRLDTYADLWAVRGNASQRLGRHAESVQAYERALRLRPGEQRWMLGAAVSLAALGQLETAAGYVEQARAAGPVSPEVLQYLRQAGVPMR